MIQIRTRSEANQSNQCGDQSGVRFPKPKFITNNFVGCNVTVNCQPTTCKLTVVNWLATIVYGFGKWTPDQCGMETVSGLE